MKIKFFLSPYIKAEKANYQHNAVVLAEGFDSLGIEYCGNINYWYNKNDYLIKENKNTSSDISIFTSNYILDDPEKLNCLPKSFNVLIDSMDGLETLAFSHSKYFDLVLRTHFNTYISYSKNVKPWIFGLSNRIIEAINYSENNKIKDQIFINYRVEHGVRNEAINGLKGIRQKKYDFFQEITSPLMDVKDFEQSSLYNQSGRRHDPRYFDLLNQSRFTFAFGGEKALKPMRVNSNYEKLRRKVYLINNALQRRNINIFDSYFIYQFDSWRLWESFYSNSIPITLDLKMYRHMLPIMPENFEHYIGIRDLSSAKEWKQIVNLPEYKLADISRNGTNWVIENYSPQQTAKLFLSSL